MKRQLLAAAAMFVGLAVISPEMARTEIGMGQEARPGEGIAGEFQLAKLNKPKKKKRACRRKKQGSRKKVRRAGGESFMAGRAFF